MEKIEHTPGPWIKLVFGKGAKGGNIYPQNCHYTHPTRIDYSFSNAVTADEYKDCQVAIDYIEKATQCHEELLEALKALVNFEEEYPHQFYGDVKDFIIEAKQAIAKATKGE